MSVYYNQTNITPGTSQFITRAEVIEGLSTLAGDLSGVNLSSLFMTTTPNFSTINMNPNGLVTGYSAAQFKQVNFSTTQAIALTNIYNFPGAITATLPNTASNTAPVVASGFKAQLFTNNDAQPRIDYNYNVITATSNGSNFYPLAAFLPTGPGSNLWNLTNVSTINGNPVGTTSGTFTSLTGSNLTLTGQLISPQIVSLASVNGLPYQSVVTAPYNGGSSLTVPNNTSITAITVNLPASTLTNNKPYLFSIPVQFGPFPPAPLNFQLNLGVRLGGNGIITYTNTYWIASNSVSPGLLTLSGVAFTNPINIATQTLEVIVLQNSGSPWGVPITNPFSGANNNSYTLKLLT